MGNLKFKKKVSSHQTGIDLMGSKGHIESQYGVNRKKGKGCGHKMMQKCIKLTKNSHKK